MNFTINTCIEGEISALFRMRFAVLVEIRRATENRMPVTTSAFTITRIDRRKSPNSMANCSSNCSIASICPRK